MGRVQAYAEGMHWIRFALEITGAAWWIVIILVITRWVVELACPN